MTNLHPSSKLSSFRFPGFWLTALILVLTGLAGCGQPEEVTTRTREALSVVVEPVQFSNQQMIADAVGTSRALRSVTLHPITAGEVVKVDFAPGQFVEQGHVLIALDQRKEKLAVELAAFRLDEARSLHIRYKKSAETGATLPTTLEAAGTELEAARIALDQAHIALEDRSIIAPFSGYLGLTDLDVGDRVQPETEITTLDNRSSLLISFELPEVLLYKVKQGNNVTLQTWEFNSPEFEGEIVEIDSRVDPELRTFITRVQVENQNDRLRPGMSFRVRLEVMGEPYPIMPEIALQWGADGSYVWTVIDGKAQRIPVNVVQRSKGKVLVDGDINSGQLVIIEGVQRLRPGLPVQPNTAVADEASINSPLSLEKG
jgi:membrane fusion protein (multidrug efflux system)